MASGECGVWIQPRSTQHDDVDAASDSSPKHSHCRLECQAPQGSDLVSYDIIKTLSDLYFNNINPIIPLLGEEEFRGNLSQSSATTSLVHAVCLVAAKGNEAKSHLKLLQSGDKLLSVRHFCTKLHSSIMKELAWRAPIPKMTLIRILGLLSLHHEGSDGAEQASSCLSQAVHYAQTLGLQLQLPRRKDNSAAMKRVFWCLWTLDRLNAAIHSRPCCMADIDIAVDYLTPEESGSKAFDVWLKIAKLLNQVISLYRPRSGGPFPELDAGFPGFEGIMDEMQAWQLSHSTVATLHIFYLATAILAHRLKTITALPSPTQARLRQQLSAIQILRNMQDQERLNALHPIPIVVYAPSLALSVFYQHLRFSRLRSDQEDARRDFDGACGILQELRKNWEAADPMASLAQRISTALATLPSLEVLCLHRSDVMMAREEGGNDAQRCQAEEGDDESSTLDTSFDHLHDPLRFLPEAETIELFDGMNDVSWMYLDVDNPVSFESFPLIDYQSL
ncbi:hypothetical protein EDB81DRAFT_696049 [Dactylonectria macrodidyma]|uniref:Xylanolytic transcriptional activator regulatory domain-containing protein n=1 Tax=Dactylonectria macrodidyma TaxID=307937 RepID=A0A9P9E6L4_9HYPO|nr:hypothetical protein EDB81DRAFT_696049 [Dactylonectria macrodidyma]